MFQGNAPGDQNREARRAAGRRGRAARRAISPRPVQTKKPDAQTQNQRLVIALIWGITGTVLGALIIWVLLTTVLRPQPGDQLADLGHEHMVDVDAEHRPYNSSPPTSGPHINGVTGVGIYQEQLPDPLQVAVLEDGYVLAQFDCPTPCQAIEDDLTLAVGSFLQAGRKVIMAPYKGIKSADGQPRKVAITAWTRLLTSDTVDAKAVATFIKAYEGINHHEGEIGP